MQRLIPVAAAVLAGLLGLLDFTHNIELQTYDLRVHGGPSKRIEGPQGAPT